MVHHRQVQIKLDQLMRQLLSSLREVCRSISLDKVDGWCLDRITHSSASHHFNHACFPSYLPEANVL